MRKLSKTFTAISLPGCGTLALCAAIPIARAQQPLLLPDSLVISSSTYDRSQGAVASLTPHVTVLPNTATETTLAVADGNYVDVWNNASVDGSFGVTSPIKLTVINPNSGTVFNTVAVPTTQVVTSFSSKSELGLHVTRTAAGANGSQLVFVAYRNAGVGALDVSNSDAVPGQDPTNPVTFAFGSNHAFARTIVNVDSRGSFLLHADHQLRG